MYSFRKFQFDWLKLYVATPSIGDVWKKKFHEGVTPQNQFSLNIYTAGKFNISTELSGFSQTLGVGDSNLQLLIEEFPSNELVLESPIEYPACRMCLSVDGGGKWNRVRSEARSGDVIALTSGQIAAVVPKSGWAGVGVPDIHVGSSFAIDNDSFVFIMNRK